MTPSLQMLSQEEANSDFSVSVTVDIYDDDGDDYYYECDDGGDDEGDDQDPIPEPQPEPEPIIVDETDCSNDALACDSNQNLIYCCFEECTDSLDFCDEFNPVNNPETDCS